MYSAPPDVLAVIRGRGRKEGKGWEYGGEGRVRKGIGRDGKG